MSVQTALCIAGISWTHDPAGKVESLRGIGDYTDFATCNGLHDPRDVLSLKLADSSFDDSGSSDPIFRAGAWNAYRGEGSILVKCQAGRVQSRRMARFVASRPRQVDVYFPCVNRAPDGTLLLPLWHPLDKIIMMHTLPEFSGIMLHAAGLVRGDRGLVCPAKSESGKSTLSRIAVEAGWRALSDECIVIRRIGDEYRMYGTPWPGDCGYARNESARLNSLCVLTKAAENRAVTLSPAQAFARLIPASSIPMYDKGLVGRYFDIVNGLLRQVPCRDLQFTPDGRVVPILNSLIDG